ncbi:TonB-dependent receptor [Microbulbifer hydrolyticus]|uniref:Iron complex outermembrane receptor protein n=1 Tax=Microbulbifer hydrolyticus TaxID=48074 RepID=A0A6P1TFF2_9GAMM|nr:TonB-dependent receptor [Microbulbifer hydrolyticus]MBB5212684.1 iron complex outermembrane receptor protein [Microbulbifer hydrolyticus]QHQ40280.1 TonB-dependent receptor [Microbulbifer hydrolyticus]
MPAPNRSNHHHSDAMQPKTMFTGRNLLASAIALTAAFSTVPALSQQSVLEEVTVTAQKREQSMQDVSVAVSAFSGDAIDKMGFEEGLDITQQVPNMNFFAIFGEASSPSVSLRGISLVNFSDSWESPVSIYVDDVYRGNPAGSAIQLFDLERVEVLRGPQGTLYGRNTTGGLVHYVSRKPTEEFEANVSASIGSYAERILEGSMSGPITDSVRGRVAIKSTQNDGWQTNTVTGDKLNDTDSFGYRTQLEFDLTESGSLLLNVHGSSADQQSVGFAHMGYLQEAEAGADKCSVRVIQRGGCTSATFGFTGAEAVNGKFDPEHVASGAAEGLGTKIDTFGTSATLNWDFENFSLTSITAYEELDKFLQDDGDGTAVVWFDEQYAVDAEQYTQEFRLSGSTESSNWVTGVYYYKDDRGLLTEAPTTADGLWHREIVTLDSASWALFGQLEYDLSSTLTLVSGLRYTEEERDFTQDAGPSFYADAVDTRKDLSDQAITGRIGLDWRPAPDTLAYASYSTGFKSGGFSGSYNRNDLATDPVGAESINNFELGLKTTLAEVYRLNAAAFRYTVQDFQAQVFISVEEGSVITNAGDVTGTGAEVELTAPITENFEVIAGAGWLDTEFDSEQVIGVAGDFYTLDGNELPSAPGLTYNVVARYYLGLEGNGELVFQGDYSWQDDHYLQIENDPYSKHDAYGLANAKVSWHSPTDAYSLEVFARNLANEEYFTYQNTLGADWGYGVWGQPRTAGLRFNWKM